jgi:two-component sensor histidine kinase
MGERFEATAKALGGRWFDGNAFRVGEPSQRRVAVVFSDITKREADAAALRESERQLRGAVQARDRIAAIAAIHELLYRSDSFSQVDLAAYARRLLDQVGSLYDQDSRIRFSVEGEDIAIDLARAVPFGLLLNELVSNAYKHAFPPDAGGELYVALRKDGEDLELQVRDSGVGLPEGFGDGLPRTLGLQLVRMLTRQLGGTVTFQSRGGTSVDVRVPMQARIS